ncbi:MAG: hypothetical protein J2P43_03845, partial [Candidatus Dormibacteraeota bacterium]|nr:hypothetical protein [Candidatus Dormibacteraeota bacterium]
LTRGPGASNGNGLGWDTLVFEVDEPQAPAPAALTGRLANVSGTPAARTLTVEITNQGTGPANDVRIDGLALTPISGPPTTPTFIGRDPNRSPVPVVAGLASGASATVDLTLNLPQAARYNLTVSFSANGGRSHGSISISGKSLG